MIFALELLYSVLIEKTGIAYVLSDEPESQALSIDPNVTLKMFVDDIVGLVICEILELAW
jgi:hypothetical protein